MAISYACSEDHWLSYNIKCFLIHLRRGKESVQNVLIRCSVRESSVDI